VSSFKNASQQSLDHIALVPQGDVKNAQLLILNQQEDWTRHDLFYEHSRDGQACLVVRSSSYLLFRFSGFDPFRVD
jgi:hypothetical protein